MYSTSPPFFIALLLLFVALQSGNCRYLTSSCPIKGLYKLSGKWKPVPIFYSPTSLSLFFVPLLFLYLIFLSYRTNFVSICIIQHYPNRASRDSTCCVNVKLESSVRAECEVGIGVEVDCLVVLERKSDSISFFRSKKFPKMCIFYSKRILSRKK
jgi:hypothetical protein